jgi:hypothetical protein
LHDDDHLDPKYWPVENIVKLARPRYRSSFMGPSEKVLQRAAALLAKRLLDGKMLATKETVAGLEKRMLDALRANFGEEAAIQRDAERILEENKRQTTGMDQRTLLVKIKEKLARERGFVL